MKKSLFFVAAASALMLTACSSENDVLQTATQPQTTVQEQAVGFDVYTPAATNVTRAGLEGTMTTSRLQRSEYEGGGFGVYAYQVQDSKTGTGDANADTYVGNNLRTNPQGADFMVNEKLLWNATNQGWYYNPLKYWPNETDNDSQTSNAEMIGSSSKSHLDRLTFFAYAPYVAKGDISKPGITRVTDQNGHINTLPYSATGESVFDAANRYEPSIQYMASTDNPNEAVDLLWGVAPAGGLSYTAVNGRTVTVKEGEPLMDMTKPNVNTNMKFLFQHALARIGVTAVAAVDQVGAGGTLDPNTKITIEKITLTGYFGETGILNLDNKEANIANWIYANGKPLKTATFESSAATDLTKTTLTLVADHTSGKEDDATYGTIAKHLQFVGTPTAVDAASATPVAQTNRVGVTTVRQNVIQPALIDNTNGGNRNWYTMKSYKANELPYSETTPYYTDADCKTQATVTMPASYTINSKGVYTSVAQNTNFKYPMVLQNYKEGSWIKITDDNKAQYANCKPYTEKTPGTYIPKAAGGAPAKDDYVVDGILFLGIGDGNKAEFAGEQVYKKDGDNYVPQPVGTPVESGQALYVICGQKELYTPYYGNGSAITLYKRDANYFMVVPTNNFTRLENANLTGKDEKLRTVRVMIEYYITTEDGKLANGRAQTKNVIEKDVVFPSIANGKSYNLNLILGLTSVKMEAEVDDWKVINVQADLPQNTAD